jgi:hypothetical protein
MPPRSSRRPTADSGVSAARLAQLAVQLHQQVHVQIGDSPGDQRLDPGGRSAFNYRIRTAEAMRLVASGLRPAR